MDHLKFPIGPFVPQETYSDEEFSRILYTIETAPAAYGLVSENLTEEDLQKTYREGGWTIRQLIHHVGDIQMIHYTRMKQVVTDPDYRTIQLIKIEEWASTPDSLQAPIKDSLLQLDGVHRRYAHLAKSLTAEQLDLSYYHPMRGYSINQRQALAMSAWHVLHHLAHIKLALGEQLI